ncbi:hypothetical protein J0895_24215 [Phormidium pseudopriestleyi FRX01]|uniref:Transposase n=1 Tax=Phormidium pseudopriestleyi FRX01 TaxID=1759528 RepID=A0ABS3FYE6_9CYAN|nr:hypothetical protein [Phormidium pseudopriestleyi]MBO0352131.1 hypothetical protein [Phormidium pseudopriestleyi FRX01]
MSSNGSSPDIIIWIYWATSTKITEVLSPRFGGLCLGVISDRGNQIERDNAQQKDECDRLGIDKIMQPGGNRDEI